MPQLIVRHMCKDDTIRFGDLPVGHTFLSKDKTYTLVKLREIISKNGRAYSAYCYNDNEFYQVHQNTPVYPCSASMTVERSD